MLIIGLVFFVAIFGIQIFARKTRFKDSGFFGLSLLVSAVLIVLGFACFYSYQQYDFWKSNDLSKFYLPPYQSLDYFVFYIRMKFFNPYVISFIMAVLGLLAAKAMNKKYQDRFFERIEPYLLAVSMFMVGHPMWFFYLIILLILVLIIQLFNTIRYSLVASRLSLYYLWLPAAIFTILISKWLSVLPWWEILKL